MSGAYGEPDWATPSASAPSPAASASAPAGTSSWAAEEDFGGAGAANPNSSATSNAPRKNSNWIQRILSILCMGLAAMMCCLGVFGILEHGELSEIFVSIYMILFSILLFCYELMWWTSIDKINRNLRMNFGFLYGVKGKAAYLIFIALLVIGLKDDVDVKFLRYMTGGSYLGIGVILLFLHVTKPDLLATFKAPTAGFSGNSPV
ncbi:hypothetical protein ACHAXS_013968 [Conticribra weissflogii]